VDSNKQIAQVFVLSEKWVFLFRLLLLFSLSWMGKICVALLTKYGTLLMLALPWKNQPYAQNSDAFSLIDLEP